MADAEEERVLVVGKFDFLGFGVCEQLLQFLECLARNEHALLAADAFEILAGLLDKREAMAICGDHGERFSLEDEKRAVERVARFFVGDGEDGARDECAQRCKRDAGDGDGGELRDLRDSWRAPCRPSWCWSGRCGFAPSGFRAA